LPKCFFAKMTLCQNDSLQEIPCKSAPWKKYLCRVSLCRLWSLKFINHSAITTLG
jgi:hypothetical protein